MSALTTDQAFSLAMQHHAAGRLAEAEAIYRQILAVEPRHVDALQFLGILAHQVGRSDVAVEMLLAAIVLAPGVPALHSNLGEAYRKLGRFAEAAAALRRAVILKPDFPEAHYNLGCTLTDEGRLDEAICAYREAIRLKPELAEAHSNLGNALRDKGSPDEAIAACRRAIALRPDFADAHGNLGNALRDHGDPDGAISAYRRAILLKPDFADAHSNLGAALTETGDPAAAIAACRRALQIQPNLAAAHNNLGIALAEAGQLHEAIAAYRRALHLKPDFAEAHSNLLYHMHCPPASDAEGLFREHCRWAEIHARPLENHGGPHANDRNPERRLRIGFVSPDFRNHPVAFFLEGLLCACDPSQLEVFCYANLGRGDEVTERLRKHVHAWRNIVGLKDAEAAALVRQDGIDILIDLAGHTAGNRLLLFARKAAPVQVTFLGYCDTTGMNAVDYRLTDHHADPAGATEPLHTERLVRLPRTAWCFRPLEPSPEVTPLPALSSGHIIFGCFNARRKVTDEALSLWSRLLNEVPGSRMLLKGSGYSGSSVQEHIRATLASAGIAPERVEFLGRTPKVAEHLAAYRHMDIALDTFPYSGTTTTCDALWMGVPVVTLAGRTHASRVGVSLLTNAGLTDLIAATADDYIRIAMQLASDVRRLTRLRSGLRDRLKTSPLMDASSYARAMEQAFRGMWRAWCDGHGAHRKA